MKEGSYQDTISSWSYNSFLLTRNEHFEVRKLLKVDNFIEPQDAIFFYGENKIAWENLLIFLIAFGLLICGSHQKDSNKTIKRDKITLILIFGISIGVSYLPCNTHLLVHSVIAIMSFLLMMLHIFDAYLFDTGLGLGIGWAVGIFVWNPSTWPGVVTILLIYGIIPLILIFYEKKEIRENWRFEVMLNELLSSPAMRGFFFC